MAPSDTGHLFVVHGRMESIHADAAIVPVGPTFHFEPYWEPIVGRATNPPPRWAKEGWGRVFGGRRRFWAVSTSRWSDSYDSVLDRVVSCLSSVDNRRGKHDPVRGEGTRPLVTVPVIGIGRGGFGGQRGLAVRRLVDRLTEAARDLDLDIALVTPSSSVHAAAQHARQHTPTPLDPVAEKAAKRLGGLARNGDLALFLGAGVGVPAGLPTWHQLVEQLAEAHDIRSLAHGDTELTVTDQAQLIEKSAGKAFRQDIARLVSKHTTPSLLHGLLAGLGCREAVTTNYDLLYETAVAATGRSIGSVLPWQAAQSADRWVLKLHGDVEHPDKIVLTRRHMVMYDALNRPSGAVLQSLLLTKHLLVVGASMSDDNVVRLAHEVDSYRAEHQQPPTSFGTVLDAGGDLVRKELWDDQLDWMLMPDVSGGTGPRGVELFLDRVRFHAVRTSSWLLDARFDGLLDRSGEDQQLAADVRALHQRLLDRPGTMWNPLIERLEEMGIRSDDRAPGRRPAG